MKRSMQALFILLLLQSFLIAQFSIIHEFNGGTNDGAGPWFGHMTVDGTTLYGMAKMGGDNDMGTIFKFNYDGTGYTTIHEFTGGATNGRNPMGSLIVIGSTLYGMTWFGGTNDMGTIFKMQTDGTSFTILHSFSGGSNDGKYPYGDLTPIGSTLYGMTAYGGDTDVGTIFKINSDGTGFALLHEFTGGPNEGIFPHGSLILDNTTFYGMTSQGGSYYFGSTPCGIIFKIETDGTGFTCLHEFEGGDNDGRYPWGSLLQNGATLYGMTSRGGSGFDNGTIFKIGKDGTGHTILHEFDNSTTDGALPHGDLILVNSKFYGLAVEGGANSDGVMFEMDIDGSNFTIIHNFRYSGSNGKWPYGTLTHSGEKLFGMTSRGGDFDEGIIFQYYDAALPVELVSFNGSISNDFVQLSWVTATEVNNYGFEIERFLNEYDWEKIGFVEGAGNSNSPINYLYIDKAVQSSGKYSYRLKQIDIDGTYSYSGIVELNVTAPENYELKQNFPNPFNPTTSISYSTPNDGQVILVLYDLSGSEITVLFNEYKTAGNYSYTFDASNLPSGMYFYKIRSGDFVQTKKMLLMK